MTHENTCTGCPKCNAEMLSHTPCVLPVRAADCAPVIRRSDHVYLREFCRIKARHQARLHYILPRSQAFMRIIDLDPARRSVTSRSSGTAKRTS